MPVNEFEEIIRGVTTQAFICPDKNYGTKAQLKAFIDECHPERNCCNYGYCT